MRYLFEDYALDPDRRERSRGCGCLSHSAKVASNGNRVGDATTLLGMGSALVELRRFDEAVAAAKKALRQNPSDLVAYRYLAAAFAHLGREGEAREAAASVLAVDPAFTISAFIARGGQTNAKLLIEGLRKAGVPE